MAAMAILHGLAPAAVESCRVLEIACGDGANLIPMAYAIPSSEFVGFDLADAPISRGQQRIRELGLGNIRLFQADVLDVGPELGRFDYIIAHGLYAWVPDVVRDRLLALCAELLAANGVAFVSYNTTPGGHLSMMLREMMRAGAEGIDGLEERVSEGLRFVHFVCEARPEDDPFRVLIEHQLQRIEQRALATTCHDELSEAYQPVRFLDFVSHAGRHGLQYLCGAELPGPGDPCYRSEIQPALAAAARGDELRQEQLLDYVRMRGYRETLLCRAERTVVRQFAPRQFRRLSLASAATAEPGKSPGAVAFALPGGPRMESNHRGVTALLLALSSAWPHALPLAALEPQLAEAGLALEGDGAAWLFRLAIARMIELRAWSPPLAQGIADRPRASACSRQEARANARATTLLHTTGAFDDARIRHLLSLLDGTRDRSALLAQMSAEFPGTPREELEAGIASGLQLFLRAGVLER